VAVRGLSVTHVPLGAIAGAVFLAVVLASGTATTAGMVFPWLLSRHGKDPALGSGPVATIVQDVLSLLIYFGVSVALVR
jgi:magnesium transporter